MPQYLANHILKMSDDDSDGVLDFEEFYQMSRRQDWMINRLLFKYCKLIVPGPRRQEQDEIGNTHFPPLFLELLYFTI